MWKTIIGFILGIITLIGWYGLVFGSNLVFGSDTKFVATLSDSVYPNSDELSKTIAIYQSQNDISSFKVRSLCNISSSFLTQEQGLYFFEIDYKNAPDCKNGNIYLESLGQKYVGTMHDISIVRSADLVLQYVDYSDSDLKWLAEKLTPVIKKNAIFKNYNGAEITKNYSFLKGQRLYNEAILAQEVIQTILKARLQKYISPVPGGNISENPNKIPNAGRPYRSAYTDGIHHWWDIDAALNSDVVALDDGVIVRIVDDFMDSDFSRVVYGAGMSDNQKLKNLDILRWNQVWLKTMKGEVIFYSHLSSVVDSLQEWQLVQSGTKLGKIGVSWVPESGYDDYHLHFPIMKNPYNASRAGSYDFWDYMSWDWQTKWLNTAQTIAAQKNIFK